MPIVHVPSDAAFKRSAARFLNHAWEIVMRYMRLLDDLNGTEPAMKSREVDRFWRATRDSMLIAMAITHEGIDHLLKSRIASKSSFLLISEVPQKWPKLNAEGNIPFDDFKTLDAQDVVKVYNYIEKAPLPPDFVNKINKLRHDRNRIVHSTSKRITPEAKQIVSMIFHSTELLVGKKSWIDMRRDAAENSPDYKFPYEAGGVSSILNMELGYAIKLLDPAEVFSYLGIDKKRRFYRCPECLEDCFESEGDTMMFEPGIAQLTSKEPGTKELYCAICDATYPVIRKRCSESSCKGDVIFDEPESDVRCLTCGAFQR